MKKILSKFYGVPFFVKEYWPYYHADFLSEMKSKGLEIGGLPYNASRGQMVCFLRSQTHEFIYKIVDVIKLKGSDFFEGTDKEYNLKFHCRIKLRNDS